MLDRISHCKTASYRRVTSLAAISFISFFTLGSQALAIEVPPSVSPGQVEKRMAPSQKPVERLQLDIPAPVEEQKVPEDLRAKLEKSRFTLNKVVVEGATVFGTVDLEFAFEDKLGQQISLLDARVIANRITALYRNSGYILSQAVIPAQNVTNGTLKIRVVEGYISNVSFEGDIGSEDQRENLEAYATQIKASRPSNMTGLERYMLLMNDLPGSTIAGLIRPSGSQFGAADLVLTVRRKRLEGSYTFDNRGSKYLGPWQHTFMLGANSVFTPYDHTQVRIMTTTPFKELFLAEVQHEQMLDDQGTKLTLMASHVDTKPGDDLKYLKIEGQSDFFALKVSHPFLRSRQQSLVTRAVFDVRNTGVDVFSNTALTRDRLRVVRGGATYTFLDNLRGSDAIDVSVSQGLNIFEATNVGSMRSNPIGASDFTKANFELSRLQPLDNGFSVLTSATGQFSFEPLLADEKFSLGGADFGRAFDPGESLGDSGLGGKIEARYDGFVDDPYFDSYQLFSYFDLGEVWTRGTAAGSKLGSQSLASVGLGARLRFNEFLSGTVEANFPVIKPISDQTNYRHNPRIFFSITARY